MVNTAKPCYARFEEGHEGTDTNAERYVLCFTSG